MMALSDLIHKSKSNSVATATVATTATYDRQARATVANVASVAVAKPTVLKIDNADDDRHHCRECRHLSSVGYCIQQRFRPIDDIPRRCENFTRYPDQIGRHTSSEAAHNAQGRYFKWLITRQDGSQFYSCSMPRMTLAEVREQYPDAAAIEPVTGEDYGDEG